MEELFSDEYFMKKAINQAIEAYNKNEVPVGAVIVSNQKIIARGYNLTETLTDVTAHAEIQSITAAASYLGAKYLKNCTLYVTLEPCVMCAGALYWSQISRVVVGAADLQRGYRAKGLGLHQKTDVSFGLMEKECAEVLHWFFESKR